MDKNSGSSCLGFSSILTIIFVVLKLVGVINWSWWLVILPTLISLGLWLIVIIIYAIYLMHENSKYALTYTKRKKDKWKF